ncbi:Retrotransposon gag protein [Gossypium australe]|uniref:Retrotransposon gag protein n=1 Tax=Gossypium australe TaxID=47621 RepID=A0A5B6WG60_9ROSI|nr:Retrotransposon gag protein [Gossypium australe]
MRGIEAKRTKENKKKPVKCFLCCGPHRMRDYLERTKLSTDTKECEVESESETLKLGSMILSVVEARRDHK